MTNYGAYTDIVEWVMSRILMDVEDGTREITREFVKEEIMDEIESITDELMGRIDTIYRDALEEYGDYYQPDEEDEYDE